MSLKTLIAPASAMEPTEALMAEAKVVQDSLALSKMHLFKAGALAIGPDTTAAELLAAKCDYTGYVSTGIAVTAFNDPFKDDEDGGVLLLSPLVQFNTDDVVTVPNTVGGAFLIDADGALRGVGEFDTPQLMNDSTNSIAVVFGRRFE